MVARSGSPLWYTTESLHALVHSPEVDGAKAREELGYEPRPIEDTVDAIHSWFESSGMLGEGYSSSS